MYRWTAEVSVNGGEYCTNITFLAKEASIGKEREFFTEDGYYYCSEYPLYFDGNEICFDEPIECLYHE